MAPPLCDPRAVSHRAELFLKEFIEIVELAPSIKTAPPSQAELLRNVFSLMVTFEGLPEVDAKTPEP